MKTSSIVAVIVALIVIGGLVWYFVSAPAAGQPQPTTQTPTTTATNPTPSTSTASSTSGLPTSVTVTYTAQGFSPQTITVARGGSVTWVNQSGGSMWVASGVHPTHTLYDGTTQQQHCASGYNGPAPFDECASGSSFTFTFDKTGSFKYHNHLNPSSFGTVNVQ